jgi:triacylglycerol lipase
VKLALGRTVTVTRRGVQAALSPGRLRGAGVEVAWIATHVAMYPLGFLRERLPDPAHRYTLTGMPPVHRGLFINDVEAAGTPILLVHGMVDNRSIFAVLRRGLRRRGFGRVSTMNYSVLTGDVRAAARRLGERVDLLCAETGYERIHVVGHSLGGLVARYYVQRLGGDQRVHTLVTLGTPHAGTHAARLLPQRIGRQLRPGSDVLAELAEPAAGCRTRFLSFWTDLDQLIVPKRSAMLEHPDLRARNVFVGGVGHMSLPINGQVVHEICATLAYLDADGSTLAAGATPISTSGRSRLRRSPRRGGMRESTG